jgi:serine protease Do
MKNRVRRSLKGLLILGVVGISLGQIPDTTAQDATDFQHIISRAKSEVFPALVFVKPIIEAYESGEKTQHEVFGSGVIIDPAGYAVTNWHVVNNAIAINCVLHDKQQLPVELIGSDRDTDLALLKLPALAPGQAYPSACLADTALLSEGDFVMALGSPFGFQRSISLGIVSNAQRYLGFKTDHKYNTWIQTDAAINPGNSGGPLVDTQGRVVGINTLGLQGSGLGFSIPASMVQRITTRLKQDGRVMRAYTGLRLQALKDFYSNTFTPGDQGVLITGVDENSPAAKAGIRTGDIILSINGEPVEGIYAERLPRIWRQLADLPIGTPIPVAIQRGNKRLRIDMSAEPEAKSEGDDFECPRWNMTLKEINKYRTPRLHYLRTAGVYVQGIKYPGNAARAGLGRRDIILKMDNQAVVTIADARRIYEEVMKDEGREKKLMIEVLRTGLRKWIVLDYRRDYQEE